jgi:hypothetical protein
VHYKHELARLLVRLKKYKPVKMETDQHIKTGTLAKLRLLMHPQAVGNAENSRKRAYSAWFSLNWSLELCHHQ